MKTTTRQNDLFLRNHGGKRKRAGRAKIKPHETNHTARGLIQSKPLHLTLRVRGDIPNLRTKQRFHFIQEGLIRSHLSDFRILHYSIQKNHIHILAEAENGKALERGMKRFTIFLAKKLNRALDRKGSVFAGRFFSRILKTPQQVKNVLKYVLQNAAKHMGRKFYYDCFSSSHYFRDWNKLIGFHPKTPLYPQDWFYCDTLRKPTFWLAKTGWKLA